MTNTAGGYIYGRDDCDMTIAGTCFVSKETNTHISHRAQKLMKVLVENYLKHGQPLGSKTLAEISDLSVSSATIRNIMGELEQSGFVESPHTSAGRVPTTQGYRLFVDNFLTIRQLNETAVKQLETQLLPEKPAVELLPKASLLLSELTSLAGIVRVPSKKVTRIKQIEFLPLEEKRVLAILVLDDNEVQNKVIHTHRFYTRDELQKAANYVNAHLVGEELSVARASILKQMQKEKAEVDSLMKVAVDLAHKSLDDDTISASDDYHLSGDRNLLDFVEAGDLSNLKAIFEAFHQKQDILALLDKAIYADGVRIFIGEESDTRGFKACSVISAPYHIDNQPVGVLAVVGPTRMRYDKVIPIVDITAKLLSSALNQTD